MLFFTFPTFSRGNGIRRFWNKRIGGLSVWAVLASVSGAGVSAVNIQHKHNMQKIE